MIDTPQLPRQKEHFLICLWGNKFPSPKHHTGSSCDLFPRQTNLRGREFKSEALLPTGCPTPFLHLAPAPVHSVGPGRGLVQWGYSCLYLLAPPLCSSCKHRLLAADGQQSPRGLIPGPFVPSLSLPHSLWRKVKEEGRNKEWKTEWGWSGMLVTLSKVAL